jgi:hypothetical protein
MGQYFKLINTTKRKQISAWKLGSVAKFFEWLYNNQARILVWLLRKSDEGGGGDIPDWTKYQTLGRWAGDHISLIGDYDSSKLWQTTEEFTDISELVRTEYNQAVEEDGSRDDFGL